MNNEISYWIEENKRDETIIEYICSKCSQRYWFTKNGYCIMCGAKLIFYIRSKEHQHATDAKLVREKMIENEIK